MGPKRNEGWDEKWAQREQMWRSYRRFMIALVGALCFGAAGFATLLLAPEWLAILFGSVVFFAVAFIIAHIGTMRTYARDSGYWWLNRPYRWWE